MAIDIRITHASSVADDLASIAERWADVRDVSGSVDVPTAGLGPSIGRLLAADRALSARAAEQVAGLADDVASMTERARTADRW